MSYTALARKWRPHRFEDLVGQEHVLQALTHALDAGRVHHAFLFTGTRGVGKTTIARILAKCLNCEKGVSSRPCGECPTCREIDEGRFIDLIEVDAASRTKVEDTRELLDNVQYAPTRGRYKVYLIDEVHMLSTHSFNALLKTLEEPPPHVKFLLATTDPQKLPVTVLSRCLQFNLKRLSQTLIQQRMKFILDAEGIASEPKALRLLAQAADGSMRDGLSLLDQLVSFGGGKVEEAATRAMLGTIDRDHVTRIADLLAAQDGAGLLQQARELEQWSPDYGQVLADLASLLARVALHQTVRQFEPDELFDAEVVQRLADGMSPEDVQLYYQTAILGRRDLELAPTAATGFEMTLLRMLAFRPLSASVSSGGTARGPARGDAARGDAVRGEARRTEAQAQTSDGATSGKAPAATAAAAARAAALPETIDAAGWLELVMQLDLGGLARQLAGHCALVAHEGAVLKLALDPRQHLLRTRAQEEKLAQALSRHFGVPMRVEIELAAAAEVDTLAQAQQREAGAALEQARATIESDPTVRALKDRLGATVQADSVRGRNRQE